MKTKVRNELKRLTTIAKKEWGFDVDIKISYKLDSIRTLGYYRYSTKTISLNDALLDEFKGLYIREVFVHEFAHAVVHFLYPTQYNKNKKVRPHGKEFKEVCRIFGVDASATTSVFNNSKVIKEKNQKTRVLFSCACSEHYVSKAVANKIINGAKYSCNSCKSHLTISPEQKVA
jgi:predicted SprT family Zn-dependent metalloprotease